MLFLFQAVQLLPPIHITVQSPPPAGLPEWVRTLITAGVGAVFGITSSILMEYVKPAIAKRMLRKAIKRQLLKEVYVNLISVTSAIRGVRAAADKDSSIQESAIREAVTHLKQVKMSRYRALLETDYAIRDELDPLSFLEFAYNRLQNFVTSPPVFPLALSELKHISDDLQRASKFRSIRKINLEKL